MSAATDDTSLPKLFAHATRKEWGVGVLAWETANKRGYLFHDGVERTLAAGFYEMMGIVEHPSEDQAILCQRLRRVLAGRATANAHHLITETNGQTFYDQVARLRKTYSGGLLDPKWIEEVRGEGAKPRSLRRRTTLIAEAQQQLSAEALDTLLSSQRYAQIWDVVVALLGNTDLVPKSQLAPAKAVRSEQQRELALSIRDVLYGNGAYEPRFNRFLAALSAHSGKPASWEIATALSAIVHPTEHVCVHATVFRLQFRIIGTPGTPPAAKPTGAGYARVLAASRVVAQKLADQGEVSRDLLDVHDFIRVTLKPAAHTRVGAKVSPRSKATAASRRAEPSSDAPESAAD